MGHTLIVGRAGSGKSELLHTLAERFNEDTSIYIIDHGGGRLKDQSQKSCCGGYISEDESEDIERLMIFIEEELSARRRRSGCKTREKSPVILVTDGLESVEKASEEFREHLIRTYCGKSGKYPRNCRILRDTGREGLKALRYIPVSR